MFPEFNIIALVIAAVVPNALGALYYGPLFGKIWLKSMGKTKEEMKPKNEAIVYLGAFVLAFILANALSFSIAMGHKDVNEVGELVFASHGTFAHGTLHGGMFGLAIAAPIIASLGLFHKSKVVTIILNIVFWCVCTAIMGGILDVWK